jgi:tRNA A37 threonylcarbamoyladenosine dehydratase
MIDMFIKRSKYEAMEARIKELEAKCYDYLIEVAEQTVRITELSIEKAELQLREIEMQKYMEDCLDDIKWRAEIIKEELDSKDAYIEELEEALYEENPNHILVRGMHGYMAEKDAIDAVFRVSDEVLLLNAPIEVNDVNEATNEVSEYHIVIERGLDMVSDVDEVIFLRELMSEPDEVSKQVEIEARVRRMKDKIRKPQIEKDEHSGRVAGRPPVPPKPIKKVC